MLLTPQLDPHQDRISAADDVRARYSRIRSLTQRLCDPLTPEDMVVQSILETSPPKWHLAHTTWFFETFLLKPYLNDYRAFHPQFDYLFNSYYETVGHMWKRSERGLLSRPTTQEILKYRSYVDAHISENEFPRHLIELGLHHEQQHQELLLTDVKHNFGINPLRPKYHDRIADRSIATTDLRWIEFSGGLVRVGANDGPFHFDNETPRHTRYIEPFFLADRLSTCGEYLEFIESGAYVEPQWWSADGWAYLRRNNIIGPLYWSQEANGRWSIYTLAGEKPLNFGEPVAHVSYYEADAFARWSGARLPTEFEWEAASQKHKAIEQSFNFMEEGLLHPRGVSLNTNELKQFYGDLWEWTSSPYLPYPGFKPLEGSLGEYNGKFMCNQMVLKGGACVTPADHIRCTYRNFFYPHDRWAFAGIRLAKDLQ